MRSGAGQSRTFSVFFFAAFLLSWRSSEAAHPCEAEVTSACPERPGSEIAACLKDKEQHDTPTEISSECTDFIALHVACAEEIENLCDASFFTDDTTLCLTQWVSPTQLSERCSGVMSWAIPQKEDEEGEGPTDELGMSEKDYQEKLEWQKKRREQRGDAIERMKMKEADRKKEEDRVALEKFKEEDPEGYANMVAQQEEEKRQQALQKKRERQIAAALERKKKKEQGIEDEEESPSPSPKSSSRPKAKANGVGGSSRIMAIFAFVFVGVVCVAAYFMIAGMDTKGKSGGKKKQGKRK